MRIFHIASVADWEAAQRMGTYTTSTYGVTLAEEGSDSHHGAGGA